MKLRKRIQKPQSVVTPVTMAFTYSVEFTTLLRASSQDKSFSIHSDSDFELFKMTASTFTNTDTPSTYPDILNGARYAGIQCQLIENDNEQKLSSLPIPMPCLFGTGQQPFILSNSKIFAANSTVSIRMINQYTGEDIDKIRLSFIGRKIFRAGFGSVT